MAGPMYCVICGYDLSHSPEQRCSECGVRFSRNDSESYSTSPALLQRVLRRAPRLRAWIVERYGTVHCRGCARDLKGVNDTRCPECHAWFDSSDLTTVLRSFRFIPTPLLRFHHVCFWRGVLAPTVLLIYSIFCLLTSSAHLPGSPVYGGPFELLPLSGAPAYAMAIAWLGAALGLHARYFWGHVEPWWRYAPIVTYLGVTLVVSGWGYAFWWAFSHTFA